MQNSNIRMKEQKVVEEITLDKGRKDEQIWRRRRRRRKEGGRK